MHAPTANTVEIVAAHIREKSGTRRDQWAVHVVTVIDPGAAEGLREGMMIEVSGESRPYDDDSSEKAELRANCEYTFSGTLHEGKVFRGTKTPVFKFKEFSRTEPLTKAGVLSYLQDLGGIGPKLAIAMFEEFGLEAVKVLRESPELAARVRTPSGKRLTIEEARKAAVELKRIQALERTTIQVRGLLDGYGLPKSLPKKVVHLWGPRAPSVIRRNPLWQLMKFRGVGFLKADKVYQAQGLPLDALKRMTLCAWHHLSSDANGHTWFPRESVLKEIRLKVGGSPSSRKPPRPTQERIVDETPADRAIRLGVRSGLLAEYTDDNGCRWLAEGEKARDERALADVVLSAMDEPNPWERALNSEHRDACLSILSDHQRERLLSVLSRGSIVILGGGPGTGKTFTAAALIKLLLAVYGPGSIAGTAFTGKASQRLTEGLARYGIDLKAKTTHSLLKVKNFSDDADDDGERSEFEYNAANPLPFTIINADEFSMDDVPLAYALLSARSRGAGVLIIGDVHQLPPIGHGAPLRDLIAAGIPYSELTEIRRNAGQVVRLCKKLRENQRLSITDFCRLEQLEPDADDPTNCALVHASSPQAVLSDVVRTLKFVREKFNYDPIWNCQVIVARNDKGELARTKLNALLQREFNPSAAVVPGCRFRVGDKAIQLKNMEYEEVESLIGEWKATGGKAKVANGEFARILEVEEKRIIARFFTPDRFVAIPRTKEFPAAAGGLRGEGSSSASGESTAEAAPKLAFDLGYAATCHKMQGSQERCIVTVLDDGAFNTSCEWFNTAESRMEKAVVNVGTFATIQKMVGNREIWKRKTFLKELIEAGRLFAGRVWWVDENNEVTV
jgi:exodeoxyribonuclease V alpha subunit